MKAFLSIALSLAAVALLGGSLVAAAEGAGTSLDVPGPFKPDWASLKAHQDPEWFRDAKFGIYTHWGPVAVGCEDAPQGGEWYGREMYETNSLIFAYLLRGEFSSACGPSALRVTVASQSHTSDVPRTDGWFKPRFVSFGELQFEKAGVFHLVLEAFLDRPLARRERVPASTRGLALTKRKRP